MCHYICVYAATAVFLENKGTSAIATFAIGKVHVLEVLSREGVGKDLKV